MQSSHLPDSHTFKKRRVAFLEPHLDMATNPSLVCLTRALRRCGAQVDVFMPFSRNFPSLDNAFSQYPFPGSPLLWYGDVTSTFRNWYGHFRFRPQGIKRLLTPGYYDLILGIDSAGVIQGYEIARKSNVPLVYLSFEIFFHNELQNLSELKEKEIETQASQFADLIIIQDESRARLLATENNLPLNRFAYLALSPEGPAETKRSDFLRGRFGISSKQTIVLHSGSFAPWTCAEEILDSVNSWPLDFVLVIHTQYRNRPNRKFSRAKHKIPNVIFSSEPLPIEDYNEMLASADIGLSLYKSFPGSRYTQKNVETIGLSSGKFAFYMKYGLPVVSIKQQMYARLLQDYHFGENIDTFSELPSALSRLKLNFSYHRSEAVRLFSEKLDFNVHWPKLAERFLQVMR